MLVHENEYVKIYRPSGKKGIVEVTIAVVDSDLADELIEAINKIRISVCKCGKPFIVNSPTHRKCERCR